MATEAGKPDSGDRPVMAENPPGYNKHLWATLAVISG